MTKLQRQVENRIEELQKIAQNISKDGLNVEVTIAYDLDDARRVGVYSTKTKIIHLNPNLLEEYGELYIEDTVVHEFAHAVVSTLFPLAFNPYTGKKVMSHGKEFRKVCRLFGNDGSARTSLFADSKTMKKPKRHRRFTYKCGCRTFEFSTVRHNRIQAGKQSFTCNKCRTKLSLK